MMNISWEAQHDKLSCQEKEILLSGPPQALQGYFTIENTKQEPVFVREIPLKKSSSRTAQAITSSAMAVNTMLMANEVRRQPLFISMPPTTPPGTYRASVEMNGEKREVAVMVQENLELELVPSEIVFFSAKPGETCQKEVLLVNKGNIPVIVPAIKHNTTVDMDLICRNLALALRKDKESGFKETFDVFIKSLKSDVASWASLAIREAGKLVQPGETVVLHISFTLPKDIQPTWLYEGDIRIIDQMLSYKIVPAMAETPQKSTIAVKSAKKK